jgi:hypothetical protein
MPSDKLGATLAERVMGWSVGPDRSLASKRGRLQRWGFRPAQNQNDAFRRLTAPPDGYTLGSGQEGLFWTRVVIWGVVGEARHPKPDTGFTVAFARTIGLEV